MNKVMTCQGRWRVKVKANKVWRYDLKFMSMVGEDSEEGRQGGERGWGRGSGWGRMRVFTLGDTKMGRVEDVNTTSPCTKVILMKVVRDSENEREESTRNSSDTCVWMWTCMCVWMNGWEEVSWGEKREEKMERGGRRTRKFGGGKEFIVARKALVTSVNKLILTRS